MNWHIGNHTACCRIFWFVLASFILAAASDASDVLAVNTHNLNPPPGELAMIKAAGFKTIRMDLGWAQIETSAGHYKFDVTDKYVGALSEHGLRWMAILSPSNPLYDNGTNVHTADGIAAFARFGAAVVTRYRPQVASGALLCELVNEPNNPIYNYANATLYAQLVAAASTAIRAVEPTALVVGPASENIDMPWLTQLFEAGALHHLSQLTVHPYRSDSPETAAADFAALRTLVQEYMPPDAPPLVINSGEWGYSSVPNGGTLLDDVSHGKVVARQFLVTISAGVGMSVYYDWRDGPPEIMGLVSNQYHPSRHYPYDPKPAYNATTVLSHALSGFTFVERVKVFQNGLNTEDDWVLMFHRQSGIKGSVDTLLVAWTSASFGHVCRLPGGEGCYNVTDWLGNSVDPKCHDPRGLHIMLTDSPQYLLKLASDI